ncbi:MAG: restriction endonuclease subunit S [Butyrivibrio sp.]|nr:restriction endonuclease subunit S [Butyrivibrio sp.]
MGELSEHKADLRSLLQYSLQEYGNATMMKRELMKEGHITESFGVFTAEISMVVAEKNRLYLRRYDVKTNDGNIAFSFILGHAAMLFAFSARKFRDELLQNERIKGVATLKQSVFDHIVMPAAIIILNNDSKETWLTAAENIDQLVEMFCGHFEETWKVYYTDKISSENMLPEYYNGDEQYIEEKLSGSNVKELGEVATIISGKGAKREEYADEGIPYLRARDIKDGKILKADVYISPENAEKYSRQLLQEGDILLTKNFGQNKLALVTDEDLPAIASNLLIIIRPFEVSEGYLFKYLTSETGQDIFNKQVNRIQKGVTVPSVAVSDLIHVKVPVLDVNTMQSIENIDSISRDEIVETTKNLMKNTSMFTEKQIEDAVREALISTGWLPDMFVDEKQATVNIGNGRKWMPDLAYQLDDGRKVIVEVKSNLGMIRPGWLEAMQAILHGDGDFIFVLTTGMYYEIHIPSVEKSLQMISPPTIEAILNWEKEVR